MCGADAHNIPVESRGEGSPPRVRSRRDDRAAARADQRITSACAEQTISLPSRFDLRGDHLRVCGADEFRICASYFLSGSPPRVRSRRDPSVCPLGPGGDHLRVCGADLMASLSSMLALGSPPRVRSRLHTTLPLDMNDGITSACAEQTMWDDCETGSIRDHLRVCGADTLVAIPSPAFTGSPPRVRSRRTAVGGLPQRRRITSACAEQTLRQVRIGYETGDHLRVCGADSFA